MKLRTTPDSIRLRLSQNDVRSFAENGSVEEVVEIDPLANSHFSYRLLRDKQASRVSVTYADNCVTVAIPPEVADEWTASAKVGIEAEQPRDGRGPIRLLVEKDFGCLHRRLGENDADTFPNPDAVADR